MSDLAPSHLVDTLLTRHPREIGESYGEHAVHATYIGARMIVAGFACLVHAVLPGLFVRTATRAVADIESLMNTRSSRALADAGRSGPYSPATMIEKFSKAYSRFPSVTT